MSADSQHRSKSQSRNNGDPTTVSPQQVTDPTILDSVAGFINDVVPNAYNIPGDLKDQIQWAHLEQLDNDNYGQSTDVEHPVAQPLILVLGYTNGIQVFLATLYIDIIDGNNIILYRYGPFPQMGKL